MGRLQTVGSEGRQKSPSIHCRVSLADDLCRSVADLHSDGHSRGSVNIKREESRGSGASRSETATNSWQYQGTYMGYTTELDSILFDISPTGGSGYQKPDGRNAFLIRQGDVPRYAEPLPDLIQAIDRLLYSTFALSIAAYQSLRIHSSRSTMVIGKSPWILLCYVLSTSFQRLRRLIIWAI